MERSVGLIITGRMTTCLRCLMIPSLCLLSIIVWSISNLLSVNTLFLYTWIYCTSSCLDNEQTNHRNNMVWSSRNATIHPNPKHYFRQGYLNTIVNHKLLNNLAIPVSAHRYCAFKDLTALAVSVVEFLITVASSRITRSHQIPFQVLSIIVLYSNTITILSNLQRRCSRFPFSHVSCVWSNYQIKLAYLIAISLPLFQRSHSPI